MERLKERRDKFLEGKRELLLHFLPDNDYFMKKEKREKRGIEKEKKMKEEAVALALNTAHADNTTASDHSGSSIDDAAKSIVALSGCESTMTINAAAGEDGDAETDVAHKSVKTMESEGTTSSSKSVSWDQKSLADSQSQLSSVKGVIEGTEDEEDADADAGNEPVELQVSYAMRGVPIVAQPPTLIAELHEHQVQLFVVVFILMPHKCVNYEVPLTRRCLRLSSLRVTGMHREQFEEYLKFPVYWFTYSIHLPFLRIFC